MAEITEHHLDNWFSHHRPLPGQTEMYDRLRQAGRAFAQVILDFCPPGEERAIAIQRVREAVMMAVQGLACMDAKQYAQEVLRALGREQSEGRRFLRTVGWDDAAQGIVQQIERGELPALTPENPPGEKPTG